MRQIDINDVGKHHIQIGLLRLKLADRRCDLGGCKHCRRYLVENRVEDMMIAAIDQDHFRIGSLEGPHRGNSSKAGAYDHNPGPLGSGTIADGRIVAGICLGQHRSSPHD